MIKRYDYDHTMSETLSAYPDGQFCLYADYAALEAENERLREALLNMIGHAKWVAAEFDVHYAFLAECEAALSAPKGGQDHG